MRCFIHKILLPVILAAFWGNNCIQAQAKTVTNQNLIWFTYINNTTFNPKWFLMTEVYERRFLEEFKHHHLLIRTHLHYKLKHGWDIGAGFAYSLQSPQSPSSTSTLNIPEYRPHVEVNHKWQFKNMAMSNRLRLENRFIHKSAKEELINGFTVSYRLRYLLAFDYILMRLKDDKKFKFKVSDEIMFNAGKGIDFGTFDQNRLYVAFNLDLSSSFAIEIGYLHWYQQRSSGYEYYNRNIARLTLVHKLNLSRKKSD